MAPDREEPQKALEPSAEPKQKRFRIVKLEERIAPSKGGNVTRHKCAVTVACTQTCVYTCTLPTDPDPTW